jgi:hypothetical protein
MGLATVTAPRAGAVTDAEELTRFGSEGTAAGHLDLPDTIAADPITGHVYTPDSNNRINEFTPWGGFVKAFGWDVAPGAVNEQQEVRVRAAAGQFKLSFGAFTTADLAFDAPGAESEGPGSVEAALDALGSIGGISVEEVTGTPDGKTPFIYVVAFKGSLAGTNVAQLTATNGTTPLGGGSPSTSLEVRTRADGTPGGTGLESCTTESGCQAGREGNGVGEFNSAGGVAVDAAGDIFVRESRGNRAQKFDSAGRFLLMFGGGVDQGPHHPGDVCTAANLAEGDTCGAGSEGGGSGEFAKDHDIALGADGTVFVADKERIEEFEPNGSYKGEVKVPGEFVRQLALNPKGGFYAVFATSKENIAAKANVHKLSPTGADEGSCEVTLPGVLASDSAGNLFAVGGQNTTEEGRRVLEFDPSCKPIANLAEAERPPGGGPGQRFDLNGLGTNAAGDLYVANDSPPAHESFIRLFGPAPVSFEAPPKVAPSIEAQFASSVERTGAVLGAEINPHSFTDTRYYLQYGTGKCSEGACGEEKPVPPGTILTTKVVDAPVKSAGVFLEGLQPGTTYHYRFVAQSGGGGPVRGVGGKVGTDGEESAFTTYPTPAPPRADCPNQQFRSGFSAPLPDCRAFEMVSPVDKNNGDIKALFDISNYATALDQSATSGDRFTYSSYRAFADPKAAPYTIQYMASRSEGEGWSSKAIVPPQGLSADITVNLENPYKAFSGDLCNGWLVVAAEPPAAPGATEGFPDLYRRDNCGGDGFEALVQVKPNIEPVSFYPEPQGASADGKEAILRVKDKLTKDATSGVLQTYYTKEGQLHLICILPSGVPSSENCSGGTGGGEANLTALNREASLSHAISTDGSRVYWTASPLGGPASEGSGPGKVYLRENPDQEQSALSGGECTEAEKACTIKVSETKSTKASRFLGASPDGSKALFEVTEGAQEGNLYEFELEAGASTLIGEKAVGLVGASEDLSYLYFVSTEASLEEVAEGALKGRPNLYLFHEGASGFIATLSTADANSNGSIPSDVNAEPIYHAARVSADGRRVAFISTESLSGYDNTDQATGEADSEVYLYEAGAPGPLCVSCNPSGARPQGRKTGVKVTAAILPTAATIPPPLYQLSSRRPLSADGRRLFFDSYDALLSRDTNGKEDVYEWEAASGAKECEEKGAELYVASAGGCLGLISSGQSPSDSEFLDASEGGKDAFFTTSASLLPQDPGLIDVYDARAGGGLPAPPEPPGPCQGEACQNATTPPNDATPASASFKGAGNLGAKARCSRGKVARKGRCVAKKHQRAKKGSHRRDAKHNRGASR